MKEWLKRIRAAIGMGLTWTAAWIPVGILVALALWIIGLDPPGFVWRIAGVFGVLGFLGGGIFSAVLRLAEGRRTFDELSLPRFAMWGGVGGLLLGGLAGAAVFGGPGPQLADAVVAGVTTLLGAGSAVGTLVLARKADDGVLLPGDPDAPAVAPTADKKRQLLKGAGET